MREMAALMVQQCEALAHARARLEVAIEGMTFRCPAGDQLRRALAARCRRVEASIAEVEALRRALLREAAELETAQHEVEATIRRLAAL